MNQFSIKFSAISFAISLLLCLLVSINYVSAEEKVPVNRSAIDGDIMLTVNGYSIKNNGQTIAVYYSVKCDTTCKEVDKTTMGTLIERPDVHFVDKLTHGDSSRFKKISKNKYNGVEEITIPKFKPKRKSGFHVSFNTDTILDKEGQWTIEWNVR